MPQTWIESPVAEALAQVLELYHPGNVARRAALVNKPYTVFSYLEDFDYLWSIWEDAETSITSWALSARDAVTAIVVWDGIPSSGSDINAADYVTPYDWALAWSRALVARTKIHALESGRELIASDLPQSRVLILDLCSQEYRSAFACQQFDLISPALPWIQVYRPVRKGNAEDELKYDVLSSLLSAGLEMSLLRSSFQPGFFGSEALFIDTLLSERVFSLREAYDIRRQAAQVNDSALDLTLESIAGLWRSNLLRPGGRHQIANMLAPMILAKGFPEALRKKTERELRRANNLYGAIDALMMAVGLVSPEFARGLDDERAGVAVAPRFRVSAKGILKKFLKAPDIFDRKRSIRFLLIDDRYKLGYQHILGSALFGTQYKAPTDEPGEWVFTAPEEGLDHGLARGDTFKWELRCAATAAGLFNCLSQEGRVVDWDQPHYFDPGADILLLDLRLWHEGSGQSERKALRQGFMKDLVKICDSLEVSEASGSMRILDLHFRKAYLQARKLKDGEDVSEIEALVLLPLLLSYYDPSLPIILFSSTHQRSVTEMVAHRSNIITDFAKPLLSGYGEEDAAEQIGHLNTAIMKAIALHEARCVWRRITDIDWKNIPVFEVRDSGREFIIFNRPNDYKTRFTYDKEGSSPIPPIQGNTLRPLLASHYVNYIERQRYVDFASVPWELIEASLTPQEILDRAYDSQFKIDPVLHDQERGRNAAAIVLEDIRNKKTHGHARQPSPGEEEGYRLGALLQFMILLDFIEGAQTTEEELSSPGLADLWDNLKSRHSKLTGGPRKVHNLNPGVHLSWIEFLCYAGTFAVERAREDGRCFLSNLTNLAARRLARTLIDRP